MVLGFMGKRELMISTQIGVVVVHVFGFYGEARTRDDGIEFGGMGIMIGK
jgi:hypothetical protein